MKKMFLLGALFAAGLGFTACSSDKDVAENAQPMDVNGKNYISISINLPTETSAMTRADDNNNNVTYKDGLAEEYHVNNATLILFDASENFLEAHNLTASFEKNGTDQNVTEYANSSTTNVIQAVSGSVLVGSKILVILNHNNLIEVTPLNGLKVKQNGTLTDFTGSYSSLQAFVNSATTTGLDAASMTTNGFYMANAPLSNVQGSTTTSPSDAGVRVLVPITAVYKTSSEASAATSPDQIYVERGMAKVTVQSGTGTLTSAKGGGTTNITWSTTAWTLDNTNPSSYLIRSTDDFDDFKVLKSSAASSVYRTIGNAQIAFPSAQVYGYRSYFSKSTNYASAKTLNRVTAESNFKTTFGDGSGAPQYCFENTFPVDLQLISNTTLVQLKVTSTITGEPTGDIYTIGSDKSTVYNKTTLTTDFANKAISYITTNSLLSSGTLNASDFSLTSTTLDANGIITAIELDYNGSADLINTAYEDGAGSDKTLNTTICTDALTKVSTNITQYTGGVSYYNIRIKHFGDALTPWNTTEYGSNTKPSGSTVNTIYPDNVSNRDGDYLGRYGVLRNNWYNITVNSIRFLGEAVPHTAPWPDSPDDEADQYIAFKINVLSWAKREQGANL